MSEAMAAPSGGESASPGSGAQKPKKRRALKAAVAGGLALAFLPVALFLGLIMVIASAVGAGAHSVDEYLGGTGTGGGGSGGNFVCHPPGGMPPGEGDRFSVSGGWMRTDFAAAGAVWPDDAFLGGVRREQSGHLDTSHPLMCEFQSARGRDFLHCAALQGLDGLRAAYLNHFGRNLVVGNAWRNFAGQVAARENHGTLAATPGRSIHGWALAVDFGGGHGFNSPTYRWLRENAGRFGWFHPTWAHQNGSNPEWWHWEFLPGLATECVPVDDDITTTPEGVM